MDLIQSYVPFFGNRKRFAGKGSVKALKAPPVRDAVLIVAQERKRCNDMLEDSQYFQNKKVSITNVDKDYC
jgi:hypothetical protein